MTAEKGVRPDGLYRLRTRFAIAAARPIAKLSPHRIRVVLTWICRGSRPADAEQVLEARSAIVATSARCAGLGCLQRSIATTILCRTEGRWADWCSGFRLDPFGAHAWVEANGEPVGEPPGIEQFVTTVAVRIRRDQVGVTCP